MHIVQWLNGLQGGAGVQCFHIAHELVARGHRATIIYEDLSGPSDWGTKRRSAGEVERANSIDVYWVPNRGDLASLKDKLNADCYLWHLWNPMDIGRLPISENDVDVAYCHTYSLPYLTGFDAYFFVSQSQINSVPAPTPLVRCRVIRNGIPAQELTQKSSAHLFSDEFIIARVSGLSSEKVSDSYIDIIERLRRPDTRFVFAGSGQGRDLLESRLSRNNSDDIEFRGDVDVNDVFDIYRTSHITLYMTGEHVENHSISLIEALWTGTPVICENRGGNSEMIETWRNGVVFNSPSEALQAVEYLRAHRWHLAQLSQTALKSAGSYDIDFTVTDLLREIDFLT